MIIYLDLDDTLVNTRDTLRMIMKLAYGITVPDGEFLSNKNAGPHFSDVMRSGEFMAQTPLESEVYHQMRLLADKGLDLGICTHRGYLPQAKQYTDIALKDSALVFKYEHYLHSKTCPDKIEFLNMFHKGEKYILIDDNPVHGEAPELPDNVLLIDRPWNQKHITATPDHRIKDMTRLADIVLGM